MHVSRCINSNTYNNYTNVNRGNQIFELGQATKQTTSSNNGEKIGLFSVQTGINESTVYIATYADNSTFANPIVKIGDYEVEVNKVNPEKATELEMCALLCNLDKTNPDTNKGICSFSKMRVFADIGQQNVFF